MHSNQADTDIGEVEQDVSACFGYAQHETLDIDDVIPSFSRKLHLHSNQADNGYGDVEQDVSACFGYAQHETLDIDDVIPSCTRKLHLHSNQADIINLFEISFPIVESRMVMI